MYVCWIAFELGFCYVFIIETKNRTLEETAALFDGDEATEQIVQQAAAHTGIGADIREDVSEKGSSSYVPSHEKGRA